MFVLPFNGSTAIFLRWLWKTSNLWFIPSYNNLLNRQDFGQEQSKTHGCFTVDIYPVLPDTSNNILSVLRAVLESFLFINCIL